MKNKKHTWRLPPVPLLYKNTVRHHPVYWFQDLRCCLLLFVFFGSMSFPSPAASQVKTFFVNTTSDRSDANAGEIGDDGKCDVDPSTPGDQCPLRAAIQNHNANRHLGQNEIKFNISGVPGTRSIVIEVGSFTRQPLPWVLGSLVMKGVNGPDKRRIELVGHDAGEGASGLVLRGGLCQISGFIINSFSSHGIMISGTPPPGQGGHVIKGNYIGTDQTGKFVAPNGGDGIYIENTPNNQIGGETAGDRNIIAGNFGYGIRLDGADPFVDFKPNAASNTRIFGNLIGIDADTNKVLPNQAGAIENEKAANTKIGDSTDARTSNILAGTKNGITISGSLSEGVRIEGNHFENGFYEKFNINIFGRGGKALSITQNIFTEVNETQIDLFLQIDGEYKIRKNRFTGKVLQGSKIRFGEGREIKVNYANNIHIGAGLAVDMEEALNGQIDWAFLGNTLKDGEKGVRFKFHADGTKSLNSNTFSGMASTALVWVSDHTDDGRLTFSQTNNLFFGNAKDGTQTIRGTIEGKGELVYVVSGDRIKNSGGKGTRLEIFADVALKANISLRESEYLVCASAGLQIVSDGKMIPLVRGFIEKNLYDNDIVAGIEFLSSKHFFKSVTDNTFRRITGSAILLNGNSLVHIDKNKISESTIGILINDQSVAKIEGNTITQNGKGIVLAGTGSGTVIARNIIFGNIGLGIDLANNGVTANDPGDADAGPNNLQNFPLLTSVSTATGTILVNGTLNSSPNMNYFIEFFSNAACDVSGFGEGQVFLDSLKVTTNSSGFVSFSATLPTSVSPGSYLTATARDPNNNTSEFSACRQVVGTSIVSADLAITKVADKTVLLVGDELRFTLTVKNNGLVQATNIQLQDLLPAALSFLQALPSAGVYDNVTGIWSLSSLNNGSMATLQLIARAVVAGFVVNKAIIKASDQPDFVVGNNEANVTINVQSTAPTGADLSLTKVVNKPVSFVGDELLFTTTVINNGPQPATSIFIKDRLPGGMTLLSVSTSQGSYNTVTAIWSVGSLFNGGRATLVFRVRTIKAETITNVATVAGSKPQDPNFANNEAFAPTQVMPVVPLLVQNQPAGFSNQNLLMQSIEAFSCFPNPFVDGTWVTLKLSSEEMVNVSAYDAVGRLVNVLLRGQLKAGTYTLRWQPENLAAGNHYIVLQKAGSLQTQIVQFLKK